MLSAACFCCQQCCTPAAARAPPSHTASPPRPPPYPLHTPTVQGPLKCNISFTRVAQSASFRHDVLAVPHKHSADGERLYYIP